MILLLRFVANRIAFSSYKEGRYLHGFHRSFAGLTGGPGINGAFFLFVLGIYLVLRFIITELSENDVDRMSSQTKLNWIFFAVVVIAFILEIISASNLVLSNRMPCADVDKTGSGVYQQMQDLERRAK